MSRIGGGRARAKSIKTKITTPKSRIKPKSKPKKKDFMKNKPSRMIGSILIGKQLF